MNTIGSGGTRPSAASNVHIFESDEVVGFYVASVDLFPSETKVFGDYVRANDRVLDLGVGAGRTTAALVGHVAVYVGMDISKKMVDACQTSHPRSDIRVGDATDLSQFGDNSFDVVIFSFNGIDCVDTKGRVRCIREVKRVLKDDGRFIISRHNARCLIDSPRAVLHSPIKVAVSRLVHSISATARLARRRLLHRTFWAGSGTQIDPTHGGLRLELAAPRRAILELDALGFGCLQGPVGNRYPKKYRWWNTPWYYLVVEVERPRKPATNLAGLPARP